MTTLQEPEPRRRRGRPSLLNAETSKILFDAIEGGMRYKQAAALAGISYDTLNRWRNEAEKVDASPEYCDFCNELEAARARGADALIKKIQNGADKDWKAAAWLLSRWFPKEWGSDSEGEVHVAMIPPAIFQ